jgi:hypothetical protein
MNFVCFHEHLQNYQEKSFNYNVNSLSLSLRKCSDSSKVFFSEKPHLATSKPDSLNKPYEIRQRIIPVQCHHRSVKQFALSSL